MLEDLDARRLRNHVLVITRHQMKPDDAQRLNKLTRIKVTLLFTYSGIDDKQIEPYPSHVAAESLKLMSAPTPRRYRTILYWRPPDLVELAAVPIVGGIIGEPSSWLVRPDQPIKYFATRIHGLTNQDVADAPVFADIQDDVRSALAGAALVAHNAHVDVGVLQRKLGDWQCSEVFDTLKLARRLIPDQVSYKLNALVDAFTLAEKLPDGLKPHRATYDALVTAQLFVRLATLSDMFPLSLEELRDQPPGGGSDETSPIF